MGTRSCSEAGLACENWCNHPTEEPLQVVHTRKERMTGRSRPGQRSSEHISLLTGLPDDITIDHVLTKVHWKLLNTLTTLSQEWYHAIRSGKVYNARDRTQSTQTLVIISHRAPAPLNIREPSTAISAYDPSMDQWHLLPPIPGLRDGLPQLRGVVCLKGRLYIVTGSDLQTRRIVQTRDRVYVLDFGAGARGAWKRCTCMDDCGSSKRSCGGPVREVENGMICVWGNLQI